jgi:biotin operon repressor
MTHLWKNIHQVLKDKGLEIQNIQKSFRERKAGSKHDRQNQLDR